jgi:hypothetical protein
MTEAVIEWGALPDKRNLSEIMGDVIVAACFRSGKKLLRAIT